MIKATLAEQAYHYIIEQIKYGNLKEGTKVDESEIVEELGISRTPVREALLQLASDDVIVNIARKGFFVRSFGKKEKSDACTVLGHLDGLSATYAAPFLKEEDFAVLERMVDDMDEFIANQEFERYSNMQEEFHAYYQKLCPNHPLREVIANVRIRQMATERMTNSGIKNLYHLPRGIFESPQIIAILLVGQRSCAYPCPKLYARQAV